MKTDRRGSWYLLTGVVLGAVLGLVYSWEISPVKYVDAPPSALRADYKDDYRVLIALAYTYSQDLLRAEGRLAQLKDDQTAQTLTMQAQRALADGSSPEEVRALNSLLEALGDRLTPGLLSTNEVKPATSAIRPLPDTPAAVSALLPVATNFAQTAGIPTPGAPIELLESQKVCNPALATPLIQVDVQDAAGQPVAGMEVLITWEGGEDHFFTGLQPEASLGYGEYAMTPGVVYSIQLAKGGQAAADLTPPECVAEDGSSYLGSWHLVFVQP